MRRNALAVPIALALLVTHSFAAAACSVGPDFYPRDHTELLVLGRVRSVDLGPRTASGFLEATVTLDVIRVFRGTAASPVRFVDYGSVSELRNSGTGKHDFAGGSGACGTIDEDPVGKYVLIGLAWREDSRWHANRVFGAVYTDQVDYAMYGWILERHGVANPFRITGPVPDVGAFGPALSP